MRSSISLTLLALGAIVLLLVGCGGGGDASPTKAAFIKQADAICERMDTRVSKRLKEFAKNYPGIAKNSSAEGPITKFLTVAALPEIQKEAESLGALATPKGNEQKIKAYVSEIETAVKETDEGDVKGVFDSTDRGRFQRIYKLGTAYGFKACNEPL